MSQALTVTVPAPSNRFVSGHPPVVTSLSKAEVVVTYQAVASAGKSWMSVVADANRPLLTVPTLKSGAYNQGQVSCSVQGEFISGTGGNDDTIVEITHTLSGCDLVGGTTYYAFVYVENQGTEVGTGTLSAALELNVPISNAFTATGAPVLTASPLGDEGATVSVHFSFETTDYGVGYYSLYEDAYSGLINNVMVKAGTGALCSGSYTIPASNGNTTVTDASVDGCDLDHATNYKLFVTVEDDLTRTTGFCPTSRSTSRLWRAMLPTILCGCPTFWTRRRMCQSTRSPFACRLPPTGSCGQGSRPQKTLLA
jgi:hypothetical protein